MGSYPTPSLTGYRAAALVGSYTAVNTCSVNDWKEAYGPMASLLVGTLAALSTAFPHHIIDPIPHHKHNHHRRPALPPLQYSTASWYGIEGTGACGFGTVQGGYRFASLILRCGTRIHICHRGCVTAVMSDHGPYVAGRTFDLNVNLRNAIGCPDLCTVGWRIL